MDWTVWFGLVWSLFFFFLYLSTSKCTFGHVDGFLLSCSYSLAFFAWVELVLGGEGDVLGV